MSNIFIPDFLQERVFDAVGGFLTKQVNYVWDYEKRYDDVSKVVENLKNDRDEVCDKAEEDEGRYGRAIYDNVLEWLARVDEIVVKYNKFKEDHDNNEGYALAFPFQNLNIRYRQSKIAEGIKDDVERLQHEKHDRISRWQGPPSSMGYALPTVEYEELDSRKQNMEDVKKALEDSSATMIGIHGLPGIGKTTLVIEAINRAQNQEPKLFDKVIMANVTKNPNIRKIQGQIADMLGMTLQEESENGRAGRIREKLKKEKNTLIILDDMYAKIDLDMLGIPSQSGDDKKNLILKQGIKSSNPSTTLTKSETKKVASAGQNLPEEKSDANIMRPDKKTEDISTSGSSNVEKAVQQNQKGCKILLISETKRVLSQMDVKTNLVISMDNIKPDDAKKLFKKKVGITDEKNSDLERLAIDIAKKCHGLPMSIVTTAKALKNQNRSVWEETLKTLERQKLTGTPEYSTKLSYQLLENEELKLIFLLCACMGQDALVSDLVRLCIGLGFLEGVYTAREARDQVQMLLIHLKESGLLSDSYSNDRFTMQNLVRNGALLIASENNVFVLAKRKLDEWPDEDKLEMYTAIFLHHCDVNTEEFPESLKCPKLKVFHFHNNHQHFKMPKYFFQEMKELRVLVLIGIDLSEMSSSMECLTKLRKLCLEQCINLDENLCINIGKLMKNLRILSFSGSDIKSLPIELKHLSKLQILDLSNCSELKKIPPLLISSLTSLEELYMRNTSVEWRIDNRQNNKNKNASLSELGHLNQITNVDLQIPSVAHLPKNLFFDKLHSYKIVIGSSSTHLEPDFKIPEKYQLLRYLAILEKNVGIHSQKGIKMLFERVENLLLEELNGVQDIFYALNLKGFPCLKTLSIVSTCSIRYLINPQERKHPENAFPKLETLHLYKLDNMEQLCSRVSLSSSSFCKLKVVKIKLCGLLKNVFLISMVKLLVALQTIEVSECNSLKEIVFAEDPQDANASKSLKFQELRTLSLKSLPEFHGFCSISSTAQQKVLLDEQVEFSKLERLELCSIQIHQIWNGKNPPFGKLVHLEVNGCDNLKSLLTLSMAINMKTLQSLSVSECDNMMHILLNENSNDTQSEKKVTIFPNLKSIKVRSMKSLSGICHNEFELPKASFEKLESLAIDECHKLVHVFTSNVVGIFQHVSNLSVTNCKSMKAIFESAAWEKKRTSKDATPKLQDVHFQSLPKLEHMFNMKIKQQEEILKLNNLHKIWVQDCKRLENIFSAPVAKTLENNLEELVVSDCSQLRQIVAKKEEDASSLTKFNFLKLATIKFLRLPKFKSFYPGAYGIEFSALNNLSIEQCDNLEPFREEIIDEQPNPALFPETVMNNLKSIQIESRHATLSTNYDYRRDNLEELQLSGLKDTKILYSFLYSNPNMKNLCLNDASFEELVPLERLAKIESLGVVPQLKSLKLTDLPYLQKIGFERDPILQRIETLVFQNCPCLKTIAPSNVFFSHLTKLEVVDCETLTYLMSPSTARSLGQLNTMKVINCESLEEIVSEEGQEDNKEKDDIIFKQLTTIELVSLKRLESFCSSESCAFQFPSLEKFVVSACPELKSFSQEEHMKPLPKLGKVYVVHEKDKVEAHWTNNLQETIRDIFNKKIFFKGMEKLSVSDDLAHLQQLWQCKEERPQGELFNNLKTLKLSGCKFEPYAIPSNVLFSFKNLKELEVDSCKKITGIFEMNDTEIKETSFQLKKLTLKSLPNVTHVWNPEKQGILSFKSLQIVTVEGCEDLRTLFPIALARDLKKLEKLLVSECDELSNIIEAGTVDEHLVFPCLTTLALFVLPKFTGFCSQKFTLECPALIFLGVYGCNDQLELFQSQGQENQNSTSTAKQPLFMNIKDISKMEILLLNWRHTEALSSWLTKLNNENLESLNELVLVVDDGKSNCNVAVKLSEKTPKLETLKVGFYCDETLKNILPSHDDKKILGNLKELYLFNLNELQSMSGVEYLSNQLRLLDVYYCPKLMTTIVLQSSSNLKELHIESCDAMLRLFTSSTAKMLIYLEELQVESCESLKEIVGEEQQSAMKKDEVIEFKQLERITLRSLESLECFYSGYVTLKLPSLIQLDIVDCSKMKVFSHGNVGVSRSIQVSYNDSSDDLVFHRDLNNAAVLQSLSQSRLDLGNHSELKDLWLDKVHISDEAFSFGFNSESLVVKECDEFFTTAVLPSHLLPFLSRLQELEVRRCNSVEAIFEVKDTPTDIVIPLKILTLEELPNLRHVWNKDSEGKFSLPKLEEVIVDKCASIKSVFPESVGKSNIQMLKVKNCAELVEIVAGDDVAKQVSIFSTLSSLELWNLPNLKCSLLLSHLLPFLHKLQELVVGRCGSLETIFDVKDAPTKEEDTNMIIVIPLKKLTLEKLPTLSHVWKGKLSLQKLEEVIVDECASLKSLFPELVNIQRLEVKNCEKLVEIVSRDKLAKEEEANKQVNIFSKLSCLKLWNLPHLSYIYHGMEDSEFSLSNALLPLHLLPSLHKLEELVVGNCGSFETIFDVKDAPTNDVEDTDIISVEAIFEVKDSPVNDVKDILLKKLTLEHLPTLSHIWNKNPKRSSLSFPCLEEVVVNGCKSLTSLLPASLPMSNMLKIDVKNCEELVEIVTKDEADNEETNKELIMFPKLTSLTLHNLPNFTYIYAGMQILNLPELRELDISLCKFATDSIAKVVTPHLQQLSIDKAGVMMLDNELLHLDPQNITYLRLQGFNDIDDSDAASAFNFFPNKVPLPNIQILVVADSAFKEIFPLQKPEIIHSQLLVQELELRNLHKLESIGLDHTWVTFSNLTSLKLEGCASLKSLFTSSTAKCLVQLEQLRISNCEALESLMVDYQRHDGDHDVIIFEKLEKVSLSQIPKLESFYKGNSTLNFPSLEEVEVTECNKLEYMFTFSTAKSLEILHKMKISKCESLETVVLATQEANQQHEDLTFPDLEYLTLSELPKLESFFTGNSSTLNFPKDEFEVCISQCESMKTFSHGHVEAPKLWKVEIDGVDCSIENRLNATVSQQFENRSNKQH
ncbi:uncharacterized protein [Arachis hypogaea]|uniref:uncharacterized protein n=1 Tax=Arachis hypogaea TaxID=3818 RepID=UPI0010FC45AB|nr:uncharacterized protein LOC112729695 [Arachis hypogaea]XP_029146418.1 uncharacterized protein LOC112729695 [Arachis hypogaea]XP_029146419.1 uncharacterized protein LOC112729695 [Arachis hypogaea]